MAAAWNIRGELILNCNCELFCPCVIPLGKVQPTYGYCHGWAGVEITTGHYEGTSLDGLNVGLLIDSPGPLGSGNWTTALYVDERASSDAVAGLTKIFSGNAGGPPGVLKYLVSNVLGVKQLPIRFERDGKTRQFTIPKLIEGSVEPIQGKRSDEDVVISNSEYWIGPEITVSRAITGRLRDFGRVWDLGGRSAEIVPLNWAPSKKK